MQIIIFVCDQYLGVFNMFQVVIKRTEVNTCSWRARETFCIPSARALALATIAFASPEHEYNNNNKDNNEEEKQRVQV